jgi:ATP-dependent exoDNAse (exonuclease V) beta subunit
LESELEDSSSVPRSDRLLGTLVHRLFQRQLPPELSHADVAAMVSGLLHPEESVDVPDLKDLTARAAAMYQRARQEPDTVALLSRGTPMYEVPFSLYRPGPPPVVLRGRVDCVIEHPDGALTILEFKTGQSRREHQTQLDIYRDAIAAAMPGCAVQARLVYA